MVQETQESLFTLNPLSVPRCNLSPIAPLMCSVGLSKHVKSVVGELTRRPRWCQNSVLNMHQSSTAAEASAGVTSNSH